jgi:hypothetical protein
VSAALKILGQVTVALAVAALPSSAAAQSGNITNIAPTGSGSLQATFSIDWHYCKPYGYGVYGCSWYAVAYWRPIGSDCLPDIGAQLWVGDFHETSGNETVTATFYPPNNQAFNVCLYVDGEGIAPYLVSLNSYWPPPPAPPVPPPPVSTAPAQPAPSTVSATSPTVTTATPAYHLSVDLARRAARRAMSTRFDGATNRTMRCYSVADDTVNCDVAWQRRSSRYRGTVTVTNGARGVRSTIDAKMVNSPRRR